MNRSITWLLFFAVIGFAPYTYAATVNFVASPSNPDLTTHDAWRTATVAKPLDTDGDNIYGTDGYFMPASWSVTPSYIQTLVLSPGTFVYAGDSAFAPIDDPTSPSTNINSQLYYRDSPDADIVWFSIPGTLIGPVSFRLGLLLDNAGHATLDATGIHPATFEVHQILGGSATSASINGYQGRNPPTPDADWYFFDITGAVANDVYAIRVRNNPAEWFNQVAIGGVTFDTLPAVPEPGNLVLISICLLVSMSKRKIA